MTAWPLARPPSVPLTTTELPGPFSSLLFDGTASTPSGSESSTISTWNLPGSVKAKVHFPFSSVVAVVGSWPTIGSPLSSTGVSARRCPRLLLAGVERAGETALSALARHVLLQRVLPLESPGPTRRTAAPTSAVPLGLPLARYATC